MIYFVIVIPLNPEFHPLHQNSNKWTYPLLRQGNNSDNKQARPTLCGTCASEFNNLYHKTFALLNLYCENYSRLHNIHVNNFCPLGNKRTYFSSKDKADYSVFFWPLVPYHIHLVSYIAECDCYKLLLLFCLAIASMTANEGSTGVQNMMTERKRLTDKENKTLFHLCSPPNTCAYLSRYFYCRDFNGKPWA